jgi:hypothetical protein
MAARVVDDGDEVRLLGSLLELPHYLSHPASSLRCAELRHEPCCE